MRAPGRRADDQARAARGGRNGVAPHWRGGTVVTRPGTRPSAWLFACGSGPSRENFHRGTSGSSFRNDRGDTIGQSASAFLWQNGKMTDLGAFPGDLASDAVAINNRRQIVGVSHSNSTQTAFSLAERQDDRLAEAPARRNERTNRDQ